MRAQNTSSIGLFYKSVGMVGMVFDYEELVGVTHRRWWGRDASMLTKDKPKRASL